MFIADMRSKRGCFESIMNTIKSDASKGDFASEISIRQTEKNDTFPNVYNAKPIAQILRREGYGVRVRFFKNDGMSSKGKIYVYWGWQFRPFLGIENLILWLTFRY